MFKKVLLLTCALGVTSFGSHQTPKDLGVIQKGEIVLTNLDINELFEKLPEIGIYGGCGMTFGKLGGGLLQEWDGKLKSRLVGHFREQLDKESSRFKVADEGAKPLVNNFLRAHQGLYLKLLLDKGHIYELTPAEGAVGGGIDKPVYYFSEYDEGDLKKILGDKFSVKLSNTGTDKEACLHKEVVEKVKEDLLQEVWLSDYGPYLIDLACSMIVGGTGGRVVVRPSYQEGPNFDFEDNENVEEVMRGVYKGILRDKLDLYQGRDIVSTRVPYGIRLNQDRIRERVGRLVKEFPDKWIKILLERLKGYSESRNYFDKQDEKDKKGAEVCVSGIVVPIEGYLDHLCEFCNVAQEIVGEHKSEVEAIISRDREFIENVGHFFFNGKGEIEYHPFLMKPGYLHKGAEDFRKAETEGLEEVWKFVLRMHSVNRMINLLQLVAEKEPEGKIQKVQGLEGLTKLVGDERKLREKWTWESWKALGKEERTEFVSEYLMLFMNIAKRFSGRDGLPILRDFNELSSYIIQDFIRAGNREEAKEVVGKFLKPTLESEDSDLSDDSDSEETSSFSDSSDPETEQEDGVLEFDQLVAGLRKKGMKNIKWQEYKSIREMRGTLKNFGKDDFEFLKKSCRFLLPVFKGEKLTRIKSGPEGKGRDWSADDISAIKKYIESHKGEYNNDSKKLGKAFKRAGVEVNGKSVFASSVTEHLFSLASGVVSLLRDLEYVDQLENENKREDARKKLEEAANDDSRRDRSIEEDRSETVIVV